MQENQSQPRLGRAANAPRERAVLARAARVWSTCVRPAFIAGDRVALRWIFEFRSHDGTVTRMEEPAYQRWQDELIVQEQFFYDPVQTVPGRP